MRNFLKGVPSNISENRPIIANSRSTFLDVSVIQQQLEHVLALLSSWQDEIVANDFIMLVGMALSFSFNVMEPLLQRDASKKFLYVWLGFYRVRRYMDQAGHAS